MKIFIDFDDVIFNTRKFKDDFENIFEKNGISREIFKKYYVNPKNRLAIKTFNPWIHAENISQEVNFDKEKLNTAINFFIKDLSRYIFPDILDFIRKFDKQDLHIVSFGNKEFQTKKVVSSGIARYIKNIHIIQDSKSKTIEEIIYKNEISASESMFFIEDRMKNICDVKEKFPAIVAIFMKRSEGRYQDAKCEKCCDFEARDLKACEEIIESYGC